MQNSESSPSLECPAAIEFLLHCRRQPNFPFERLGAPFYEALVPKWLALGIIEHVEPAPAWAGVQFASSSARCYGLTDLGRKHLEAIESLPFPKKPAAPSILERIDAALKKFENDVRWVTYPTTLYLGFLDRIDLRKALGLTLETMLKPAPGGGWQRYTVDPVQQEGFKYRGLLVLHVKALEHLAVA